MTKSIRILAITIGMAAILIQIVGSVVVSDGNIKYAEGMKEKDKAQDWGDDVAEAKADEKIAEGIKLVNMGRWWTDLVIPLLLLALIVAIVGCAPQPNVRTIQYQKDQSLDEPNATVKQSPESSQIGQDDQSERGRIVF